MLHWVYLNCTYLISKENYLKFILKFFLLSDHLNYQKVLLIKYCIEKSSVNKEKILKIK